MADTLTKAERSERMRRVRSKDSKAERAVRSLAHRMGYRFRLHRKSLPGTPDIVFPSRKKAIFVHGCFWHRHPDPDCKLARLPKSRLEFWKPKLEGNRRRDLKNQEKLRELGWDVLYVGKADPGHDTARTPLEQGNKVSNRLRDHLRTLRKAESTLAVEDFDCRFLVVQSGWQVAAEDYLINLFQPIWNSETDICFGVGKHGDAPSTRANRRSPWDTLHPGRDWAWSDPKMENVRSEERILSDIQSHLGSTTIYRDVDQLLKGFLEELSQL